MSSAGGVGGLEELGESGCYPGFSCGADDVVVFV